MALTSDMVQLLDAGVAHQVAGCTNAGRPVVCRGLAAQLEADGRLVVIISSLSGFEVLDAVRETGRVAINVTLPERSSAITDFRPSTRARGTRPPTNN
jgi:protein-L-isoaspartate O-methyltransferase